METQPLNISELNTITLTLEELLFSDLFMNAIIIANDNEVELTHDRILECVKALIHDVDEEVFAKYYKALEPVMIYLSDEDQTMQERYYDRARKLFDAKGFTDYGYLTGHPRAATIAESCQELTETFFLEGLQTLNPTYNWLSNYFNDCCITPRSSTDMSAVRAITERAPKVQYQVFERDSFGIVCAGFTVRSGDQITHIVC